jgi:hypothetical protein
MYVDCVFVNAAQLAKVVVYDIPVYAFSIFFKRHCV